jgi:nucleotide-binding universal stress UspA family protein
VQLAKVVGARVTGVTVSEPFPLISADPAILTEVPEEYEAQATAAAEQRLQVIRERADQTGVDYEGVHVFHEHPWEVIIEEATKRGCDLIVMASHGRRGVAALVLGSETNKVLTHSRIPTLVYR